MITARIRFIKKNYPMTTSSTEYKAPKNGMSASIRLHMYMYQVSEVTIWKIVNKDLPMLSKFVIP